MQRYTLILTLEGEYDSEEEAIEDFGQSAAEMVGTQWYTVQVDPVTCTAAHCQNPIDGDAWDGLCGDCADMANHEGYGR